MLKAVVVICPNSFRKDFCCNFFKFAEDSKITFIRSIPETTDAMNGLIKDIDYTLVSSNFFKDKKKMNNWYVATVKRGLNGHAVYTGFTTEALIHQKTFGKESIVFYDTDNENIAKDIRSYYRACASSYKVCVFEILGTGNITELLPLKGRINWYEITNGPEVPQKIYEQILNKALIFA